MNDKYITHFAHLFKFAHLPTKPVDLQRISRGFANLANELVNNEDLSGPELAVALRKLREAKDAAVTAAFKPSDVSWDDIEESLK